MVKVAVLGAGSWGTALAMVLDENGHEVRLWTIDAKQAEEINTHHTNKHYLEDLVLKDTVVATTDLEAVINWSETVLFVLPTKVTRSVAKQVGQLLKHPVHIAHASKGLEQITYKRISQILEEELPAEQVLGITVLSGPSHAEEVAKHDVTTITSASSSPEAALHIQNLFMNDYFRVYTNADVIGVELGAALKNIIALGAGAIHGLGYGDNAKAALMTRGLWEITRLGIALGAEPKTFMGLSGIGDLIVTCTSVHSRNWRAGDMLGRGMPLEEIKEQMGMVIEGVETTKAAQELSLEVGIEMPITNVIYSVLYDADNVRDAVTRLMTREKKDEFSVNYLGGSNE